MAQRNASDPRQVAKAQRREKRKAAQADDDLRAILSEPEGRRFVWRLLGFTGIFRTSFTGNSETFFNEGKRIVGLTVFADAHRVCPDLYAVMSKEAALQEAEEDREEQEETDG